MCGSVDIGEDAEVLILVRMLETAISAFEGALEKSNMDYGLHCALAETPKFENLLEIDTDGIGDDGKPYIKVVNNLLEVAFAVKLDTIVQAYKDKSFNALIRALQTGVFEWVHGITRIVGYMSRTSNWNKSKIGELNDRHRGNYLWKTEKAKESVCVGDL